MPTQEDPEILPSLSKRFSRQGSLRIALLFLVVAIVIIIFFTQSPLPSIVKLTTKSSFHSKFDLGPSDAKWNQGADVVLVTLADPVYAKCAVKMLNQSRERGWEWPIILMAIDYERFDNTTLRNLEQLGVGIVKMRPMFDSWLNEIVWNRRKVFKTTLKLLRLRKMELWFNPLFRRFGRVVYVDADGSIGEDGLVPMANVHMTDNVSIVLRQNDITFGKKMLWGEEFRGEFLQPELRKEAEKRWPNRWKTGATSWFVVDMQKMDQPEELWAQSVEILCRFRPAFRLQDQTLAALLFYDKLELFPWCSSGRELVVGLEKEELGKYCTGENLARNGRIYEHYGGKHLKKCYENLDDKLANWTTRTTRTRSVVRLEEKDGYEQFCTNASQRYGWSFNVTSYKMSTNRSTV